MNEDVKIRWVDRLRSTPKEKQIKDYYSDDNGGHCAVGTLRAMYQEERDFSNLIPMKDWAGLDVYELTSRPLPTLDQSIANANDAGVSWDIIADAIKNDL